MKISIVIILIIAFVVPVFAETPINEGTNIYPTETIAAPSILENVWGIIFPEVTQTIITTTLEPTIIPTSTHTISIVNSQPIAIELIPVIAYEENVSVSDGSGITAKQMGDTDSLKIELSKSGATKIVQAEPETKTVLSSDGLEIMQTSLTTNPALQIYYGYRIDASHPFIYLYKVDSIDTDPVVAYRTDFNAGSMLMSYVSRGQIMSIINGGIIPLYEGLP